MNIVERRFSTIGEKTRLSRFRELMWFPQSQAGVVDIFTRRIIISRGVAEVTNIIALRRSLSVVSESLDHIPDTPQLNEANVREVRTLVLVKKTLGESNRAEKSSIKINTKTLKELAVVVKKVSRCLIIGGPHTKDDCPTKQPWRCKSLLNYAISTEKKPLRSEEPRSKSENISKMRARPTLKSSYGTVLSKKPLRSVA